MLPVVSLSNLPISERVAYLWKEHRLRFGFFLIVVIVAFLSFGLGYMTAKDSTRTPIIIENR